MIVIGQEVIDWVQEKFACNDFGPSVGIGYARHGALVAGVLYNGYTVKNICMHIASDGSKQWLNRQFLWTAFDYPFNQLKCSRVTALVGEGNHDARRFDEHIGFKLEARLTDACPSGDLLVYRMLKYECRFIGERRLR